MSVASFIACVRSGKVPTRSELLDAADALDTRGACMLAEPGSADELRESRAASERAVMAQLNAEAEAKRWAERVKLLEQRIADASRALRSTP